MIKAVYEHFQKPVRFEIGTPREINRMTPAMNEQVAGFFKRIIETEQ